ncbi:MAG: transposase [Ignavibacteria bacterium]|nr:transposase [Ignavibacteria bacterium]
MIVGLQHIRTSVIYPQSNGKIERFHRTIQSECINKHSLIDFEDARNQTSRCIDYYNTRRLHSSLFCITPEDFINKRVDDRLKERNK